MSAQERKAIQLPTPNKSGGTPAMTLFNDRKSDREFATTPIKEQDLSNLLWAANGINRPDGKRTAPSAMNRQEVDIYVILPEGAYQYDAAKHQLTWIADGDHRAAVAASQEFVQTAPLCLVLASDLARLGDASSEQVKLMGAVDAGIVNQNINLACTALGLVTVPRATMDHAALKQLLKLSDSQLLLMNNPVGYPKE